MKMHSKALTWKSLRIKTTTIHSSCTSRSWRNVKIFRKLIGFVQVWSSEWTMSEWKGLNFLHATAMTLISEASGGRWTWRRAKTAVGDWWASGERRDGSRRRRDHRRIAHCQCTESWRRLLIRRWLVLGSISLFPNRHLQDSILLHFFNVKQHNYGWELGSC